MALIFRGVGLAVALSLSLVATSGCGSEGSGAQEQSQGAGAGAGGANAGGGSAGGGSAGAGGGNAGGASAGTGGGSAGAGGGSAGAGGGSAGAGGGSASAGAGGVAQVQLGFNAKGTLDTSVQLALADAMFASIPAATRARMHVRVTGGTASQTVAPDEWTDDQVNGWIGLQKKHGIGFVFVVNGNDAPDSQKKFVQRWVTAGARLSFLEMMNEYYLNKFRDPKKVGDPNFPEVTKLVTLQDYTDSILPTYMAAMSGFGLPMFVIGAPKGTDSDAWNTGIRDFVVKAQAAQPQLRLGVTVHLYDRGTPFDYGQLDVLRGLLPPGTPIAVTECGLLDASVNTPEESAARHVAHDTQALAHLVPGDYVLDQVLYSHTPLVTTLDSGGLTPKGAAVVKLFESVTP